jgi:hypothetical protein
LKEAISETKNISVKSSQYQALEKVVSLLQKNIKESQTNGINGDRKDNEQSFRMKDDQHGNI